MKREIKFSQQNQNFENVIQANQSTSCANTQNLQYENFPLALDQDSQDFTAHFQDLQMLRPNNRVQLIVQETLLLKQIKFMIF